MYYDQNSDRFFSCSKLYNFVDFVFYVWRFLMDETERHLNNGTIQSFITHRFILWGREAKVIIPRLLLQRLKEKEKIKSKNIKKASK